MSYPRYTGGASNQTLFALLPMLEYKKLVYIEPMRAGAYLWSSEDEAVTFGIAARLRFGFQARDGSRLTGMHTRRNAIEGGLSAAWSPSEWTFSTEYFTDGSDTNDGRSFRFSIFHQLLDSEHWDMGAYVDLDRIDKNITNYYFGVQPDEATATRPSYQPGATTNSSLGFSGAYRLNKTYALLFGGEMDILGAAAAKSPIVQRRASFITYFGLGLVF